MAETLLSRNAVKLGDVILYKPDTLNNNGLSSQKSPDWVIEISGDLTKGNLEGLETYAQLFDFHYEYSRDTSGHVSGEMFTSSAISHTEVSVLIPAGTYTAKIRQALNIGKMIDSVTIKRLSNMTDLKKPIQTIKYENCLITKVSQSGDYLALSIRCVKVTEINVENSQTDETQAGQNVSEIHYGKVTSA